MSPGLESSPTVTLCPCDPGGSWAAWPGSLGWALVWRTAPTATPTPSLCDPAGSRADP